MSVGTEFGGVFFVLSLRMIRHGCFGEGRGRESAVGCWWGEYGGGCCEGHPRGGGLGLWK